MSTTDDLTHELGPLLAGHYDSMDRISLTGYFRLGATLPSHPSRDNFQKHPPLSLTLWARKPRRIASERSFYRRAHCDLRVRP